MLRIKDVSVIGKKFLLLLSGARKAEGNSYDISDEYASVKYSHTRIQQILLYLTLADSNGIVGFVLEEMLAEEMSCSVGTIKQNNKVLAEAGILECERLFPGCIQVRFHDYLCSVLGLVPERDTTEIEEGDCFPIEQIDNFEKFQSIHKCTRIGVERVRELVSLRDVNALRIALRFLVLEKEAILRNQPYVYLTAKEISQTLPKYLHFSSAVIQAVKELNGIFDMSIYNTQDKVFENMDNEAIVSLLEKKPMTWFLIRLNVQEEVPLRVTLESLRDTSRKTLVIDEDFWESVEYLEFHMNFLSVQEKSGQSNQYLLYSYLDKTLYNDEFYTTFEMQDSQKWFRNCRYVFPKDNIIVMRCLWDESKKRNKWKEAW